MDEQLEILRRIAKRGIGYSQQQNDSVQCDIWQHMLDEIQRTKLAYQPIEQDNLWQTTKF